MSPLHHHLLYTALIPTPGPLHLRAHDSGLLMLLVRLDPFSYLRICSNDTSLKRALLTVLCNVTLPQSLPICSLFLSAELRTYIYIKVI